MADPAKRRMVAGAIAFAVVAAGVVGLVARGAGPGSSPSPIAQVSDQPSVAATSTPSLAPGDSPTPTPSPTAVPTPTPAPTPVLVPAPLTGRLVTPAVAARHPIAVMVDDLSPARPQSGFSSASVVWQAPAEGGIPRYMMIFQDQVPTSIGPVRSSRYYYIAWAAEWRAVYAHAGGSPQAMATLKAKGAGQYVYNADEFTHGGSFHRTTDRFPPHNLYTDGKRLHRLGVALGAKDTPMKAVWQFAADAPLAQRPVGGTIQVSYPQNSIRYDYDRTTNTYLRTVSVEGKQFDRATHIRVAPSNVIVMIMHFGPLNDGHPNKHRLEATVVGSGKAWIATNGHTVVGTWSKKSMTAPTLFFDSSGNPVTLTVGQTFVQVMPYGAPVTIKDGKAPVAEIAPSDALGATGYTF